MDKRIPETFRYYLDYLEALPTICRSVTSSRTHKNQIASLKIHNPDKGVQVWLTDSLDVVIYVLVGSHWKSLYRYRAEYSPAMLTKRLASGKPRQDIQGLSDKQFRALVRDSE